MPFCKPNSQSALAAHFGIFSACLIWGLMAPLAKDAMISGIDSVSMVFFRVLGGAALFWLSSLFLPREPVPLRDRLLFIPAAVFGLVCNQCCFIVGLSITSPINASIVTTSLPIFAMLFAFFILKEPLTAKKCGGVALGCLGAVTLIVTSASAADARVGRVQGDLLVLAAQCSYALFLSLFNHLVRKYSVVTVNKWMFLWGTLLIWPFTGQHVAALEWRSVAWQTWSETAYVVLFGTYLGYILLIRAQRVLRPTVVSVYNYVQPMVSVMVSALMGLSVFKASQALAVLLVFCGVWLVITSKSRAELEREKLLNQEPACSRPAI